MISRLIELAVKARWAVMAIVLIVAGIGVYNIMRLPIDAVPDITNRQVQINTVAPSFGPLDVERLVTYPVETAMSGIVGLEGTRSISRNGFSQVTVVFRDNVDIYFARQQVAERLSGAEVPDSVKPTLGPNDTPVGQIFQYTLESDTHSPSELRSWQDWVVSKHLMRAPGDVAHYGAGRHAQAEHWQQITSQLIADKWAELSGKSCRKFTNLQGNTELEQNRAIVANLPFILNVNLRQTGQPNTITQTQVCKVTGTDISGQKKGSVFVGETTLRNDADLLVAVAKQHRSKKRKRTNHDAAYYAAHNIRNKHTNAANNLRKRLLKLKKDSGLFEVSDVVRLPDEKRELLKRWEGTEFEVNL